MEYISPHSLAQLPSLVFYKYKQKTKNKKRATAVLFLGEMEFFQTIQHRDGY